MTFIKSYYKSLLWAIVIIVLLLIPGNKFPHNKLINIPHLDKIVHCILFMVLAYIMIFDTWFLKKKLEIRHITIIFIISIAFAGSTEIYQYYLIEFRTGSIFDFMADVLGILIASIIFRYMGNSINRLFHLIS